MDILIASPQKTTRDVLEGLVSNEPDMTVVSKTGSANDLPELAKATRPDLLVVEWSLLGSAQVDAIGALDNLDPSPGIVVYGRRSSRDSLVMNARADAYVWVGDGPKALLAALRDVYQHRVGNQSDSFVELDNGNGLSVSKRRKR